MALITATLIDHEKARDLQVQVTITATMGQLVELADHLRTSGASSGIPGRLLIGIGEVVHNIHRTHRADIAIHHVSDTIPAAHEEQAPGS